MSAQGGARKATLVAVAAVLIGGLAVVAYAIATGSDSASGAHCGELEGEPAAWQEFRGPKARDSEGGEPSQRQVLIDRALDCGTLDGKPREWVERRLGPGSASGGSQAGRVSYTLGPCVEGRNCLFDSDTEYLDLHYERGRVESVDLYAT